MSNSLFSSTEYVLYRFEYPENLFHSLRSSLSPARRNSSLTVLDLGCGTGLVSESFLKSYEAPLEIHLMDPDAEMLQKAKEQFSSNSHVCSTQVASAEKIPLSDQSIDLVLIGSAWHWMNQVQSLKEIERILKPGGMVFIFEYQFPKSSEYSELNNWIRIKFNTDWKPSVQTPRGSLKELTECWRQHPQFSQCDSKEVIQDRQHHSAELAGVIVSQSRYQHYEQKFEMNDRAKLRLQLEQSLDDFLSGRSAKFRYIYEGFLFKKRV